MCLVENRIRRGKFVLEEGNDPRDNLSFIFAKHRVNNQSSSNRTIGASEAFAGSSTIVVGDGKSGKNQSVPF